MGLALAANARGFAAEVWVNQRGPLFVDGVRQASKKAIIEVVHDDFCQMLEEKGIPLHYGDFTQQGLIDAFIQGDVPLFLISTYKLDRTNAPHWVAMSGYDDDCIYVHDSSPDEDSQTAFDCQYLPISRSDFDAMSCYGRSRLRTSVIIKKA